MRKQLSYFTAFTAVSMTLPALVSAPCQKSQLLAVLICLLYFWARSPFIHPEIFTIPLWLEMSMQLSFSLGVSLLISRKTNI
jgi:hypothetical protein